MESTRKRINKNYSRNTQPNSPALTLFAHSKHVFTTLLMTFIRFFVSWITWSTLTKVAALPTVGSFTENCSVCTSGGTLSTCSDSSFFGCPTGTYAESIEISVTSTLTITNHHYLVRKLSDHLVQAVRLFRKVLGLREQVLRGL